MAEWKLFPLEEARPADIKVFSKKEHPELELVVAQQISDLLSHFGKVEKKEIDLGNCLDVEVLKSYQTLALDEIVLENDSELIIAQYPYAEDGFFTSVGAYDVKLEDEDGCDELWLTVWDPNIDTRRRIVDEIGKRASRIILQELYEALTIISVDAATNWKPNEPPLVPHSFPVAVSEPDFEALVLQFES